MATNRERLDGLESSVLELKNSMQQVMVLLSSRKSRSKRTEKRVKNPMAGYGGYSSSSESKSASYSDNNDGIESDSTVQSKYSTKSSLGKRDKTEKHPVRMDFPRFTGEDPRVWVSRVKQYFSVQRTRDSEKVRLASFYLEGEANQWWQWFSHVNRRKSMTWKRFEKGLMLRFGSADYEDANEAINKLRQTGSFRDYLSEFECLMNCLPHWHPSSLMGAFMAGLKEEIAGDVRMLKPKDLPAAIELAKRKDEQLQRAKKIGSGTQRPNQRQLVPNPTVVTARAPISGHKRITWEEMQHRREKNLCFNCDEKFTPGHRCKNAQILLIEMAEEVGEDNDINASEGYNEPHISLNALVGETRGKTMRVMGFIHHQKIYALIDSGSSLNFISPKLAQRLRLTVTCIKPFVVKVANGEGLECKERYDSVLMSIQGYEFSVTMYALPVMGLDVVLGIPWLEQLGPVTIDYKLLTMNFAVKGQNYQICGQPKPQLEATSLNNILHDWTHGAELFCFTLHEAESLSQAFDVDGRKDLQGLLLEFKDVMAEPKELPPQREFDHRIRLVDESKAVNVAPYRYAHFQKNEIERQVNELLSSGLIRPSTSPFSSPVLLVKKKDGSWRFCTDYRALNEFTVKDRFPIPAVDDMLDELYGATHFSKLDLRSGYHQIRVHPDDVQKTAFRVHNGHYEYLVMPFGLCNAPSTFQAAMNKIFRPYLRRFILVFFDDILVYSTSSAEHLEHLRTTFTILRQHHFFIKVSKCFFGQVEVEYLGHFISKEGVRVDPRKVEAMTNWPKPVNITALRGFLGLTGYYRKFVRNYGSIAKPLTQLLKKGRFGWNEEAEQAFNALKLAMTTTPVLALPNFSEEFVIETDASGYGIGAVLSQKGRPIAFLSKAISESKLSWSTYEKEMLAILEAIRVWRPYLLGRKFKIYTDQKSLRYLLEQRITTPEQQKWLAKLLGFDYEIVYKPGKENNAADALSRRGESSQIDSSKNLEVMAISTPVWSLWEDLASATEADPTLAEVVLSLRNDPSKVSSYKLHNGCLWDDGRVVVPNNLEIRKKLLKEFHSSPSAGHSGVLRTFKRLSRSFTWTGMKKDVNQFVRQCDICQRIKADNRVPAGLLQPLPIPELVWEDISMDFVEGLPKSHGKDSILVVVDRLSKYAHFIAIAHPFTAKDVAEVFAQEVVRLHGIPRSIVSDRDRIFLSHFWRELFKLQGTELKTSSAYHPETDGQTEVVNRCLEQYLRCFVFLQPKQWESYLTWAEFWYNTTFHQSIGTSPFEAVYGRPPPVLVQYTAGSALVHEVDHALRTRDTIISELKENLAAAKNKMKQFADKHRREEQFEVGDWVFLKLQPHRQQSVFKRVHQKLASRYYGPFQVEQKIGQVAYKLALPESVKIHPVFHVSLLRRKLGENSVSQPTLPPYSVEGVPVIQPEQILQYRWVSSTAGQVCEALVQWKSLPIEDATWEPVHMLQQQFPSLNLEDRVPLQGGDNVEARRSKRKPKPNPRYES